MKTYYYITAIGLLLASCSSSRLSTTTTDDAYYTPDDDVVIVHNAPQSAPENYTPRSNPIPVRLTMFWTSMHGDIIAAVIRFVCIVPIRIENGLAVCRTYWWISADPRQTG